jgi:hypothetical protein
MKSPEEAFREFFSKNWTNSLFHDIYSKCQRGILTFEQGCEALNVSYEQKVIKVKDDVKPIGIAAIKPESSTFIREGSVNYGESKIRKNETESSQFVHLVLQKSDSLLNKFQESERIYFKSILQQKAHLADPTKVYGVQTTLASFPDYESIPRIVQIKAHRLSEILIMDLKSACMENLQIVNNNKPPRNPLDCKERKLEEINSFVGATFTEGPMDRIPQFEQASDLIPIDTNTTKMPILKRKRSISQDESERKKQNVEIIDLTEENPIQKNEESWNSSLEESSKPKMLPNSTLDYIRQFRRIVNNCPNQMSTKSNPITLEKKDSLGKPTELEHLVKDFIREVNDELRPIKIGTEDPSTFDDIELNARSSKEPGNSLEVTLNEKDAVIEKMKRDLKSNSLLKKESDIDVVGKNMSLSQNVLLGDGNPASSAVETKNVNENKDDKQGKKPLVFKFSSKIPDTFDPARYKLPESSSGLQKLLNNHKVEKNFLSQSDINNGLKFSSITSGEVNLNSSAPVQAKKSLEVTNYTIPIVERKFSINADPEEGELSYEAYGKEMVVRPVLNANPRFSPSVAEKGKLLANLANVVWNQPNCQRSHHLEPYTPLNPIPTHGTVQTPLPFNFGLNPLMMPTPPINNNGNPNLFHLTNQLNEQLMGFSRPTSGIPNSLPPFMMQRNAPFTVIPPGFQSRPPFNSKLQ